MYKKVSTQLDFVAKEQEVLKFWKDNNIFEKSVETSRNKPPFSFYDGPPTANGKPHIGHMLTRAVKDIIPRYKTMKGYNVLRKAGWDTHGLPVELEVEKAIGIRGKQQIESYGVEEFIKKCKESVWTYEKEWKDISERIGFWADMENPYITYEKPYIESVWWALRQIWDKGLIYKGHKVVPYCPSCGTGLSSHEVAQGYKEITEDSIYVQFKAKNQVNTYFLAWTTTPWTLPSNVAIVVNPGEDYAYVSYNNNTYILAKALTKKTIPEGTITKTVKGKELEYIEYEPLFDFMEFDKKAFFVTCDNYVTLNEGAGIVHIAPAFGEDDNRVAKRYNLPFVQLVNEQGKFLDIVTPWADVFVKKADPHIIEYLRERDKIFKVERIEHSYPHCWRCKSPLLYYARSGWFIEMTKLRDELVANNNKINWMPDNVKQGRFGNFLENVIDWNLSRERYWGTPLPIWLCDCGNKHMVGSMAELEELTDLDLENMEIHKPNIDELHWTCSCGGIMKRTPEVIDCWFDSGSMPFAQFNYPFQNKELFEANFPAAYISEAIDQTRGWFYTLLAISTAVFGETPYENVIVLGHTLDKHGKKMSKSDGNAISPEAILKSHGADAIRWYFYAGNLPWNSARFYEEAVREYQNKFMGTWWNVYAFYVLYANIDEFDPTKYQSTPEHLMDRWILSRLHSTIEKIDIYLNEYKIHESAKALEKLVDDLSNWYIRRCRERFWAKGMEQDKINAYMTLYSVLKNLTLISAPFVPFIAEEIYQNLVLSVEKDEPGVHLKSFPEARKDLIDRKLEKNMDFVYNMVTLGRSARNTANIKNRQPLAKMYVQMSEPVDLNYLEIVKGELNLKEVEFVRDTAEFTSYKFKPQLRTLGPKYGSLLGKIKNFLDNADYQLVNALKSGKVNVPGTEIYLEESDVLVEPVKKEGFSAESNNNIIIVLDTNLTPELIEEGLVRELISKVQTMRKEAGYEVTDKIIFHYGNNDKIKEVISNNYAEISEQLLAIKIEERPGDFNDFNGFNKEWDINGHMVNFGVSLT